MGIKRAVSKITRKYKTNDPFEIAKARNIFLRFEDLVNTYGYYSTFKRIQFIHINNRLDEIFQRFVCAHELGHAILHPKANTPFLRRNTFYSIDRMEVEANTFAVELLLPDSRIEDYRNTRLSFEEIASINGIPREVARLKSYENNSFFYTF